MRSFIECNQCGIQMGSHQAHMTDDCKRQQEINQRNKGVGRGPCPWCGQTSANFNCSSEADHRQGCPRRGGR